MEGIGQKGRSFRSKFLEVPSVKITPNDKDWFDMLKNSTKIKEVEFEYEFSDWSLALDALRENKSITSCKLMISEKLEEECKAFAEILSLNTRIKSFTVVVMPKPRQDLHVFFEPVTRAIKTNHYIEDLSIFGSVEGTTIIETLVKSCKAHPSLNRIQLKTFILRTEMMNIISDVIINTPNITELNLSGEAKLPEEFARQLKFVTRVNSTLTRLTLDEICWSGKPLGIFLRDLMQANKCTLKALHLRRSYVGQEEFAETHVEDFLTANLPIESLTLCRFDIDAENAKFLARGLARNTTLTELDLQDNNTVEGVIPVLRNHKSITSIDFRGNPTTKEDLNSLADLLKNDRKIRTLKLAPLDSISLNALWHSLKVNDTLTELELDYYGTKNLGVDPQPIKEMMELNHSITELTLNKQIAGFMHEIIEFIPPFTERNKLEQRLNVSNTLQLIAMISKNKDLHNILPKEIWCHIFSYVSYPGVLMNFAMRYRNQIFAGE
jgi:hypothetical protein